MSETEIRIRLPLSLSVSAALTAAVGAMWPNATICADPTHLVFAIPDGRAPKRTSRKQLRAILAETCDPDGDPDAFLERWTTTGPVIGVDAKTEAMQSLATWALIVLQSEAAPNYVEQTVRAVEPDGTERAFVVTAAWSKGQTPHERIKTLEAEVANLHAAAMQRPTDTKTLAPIRAALANHPRCDIHPDDDPIKCGWKRAVADIQAVLVKEDR